LRDQLKRLEELQQFDAQIQELDKALKAIPAKLEASQTDLTRVEALLESERTQLTETQRYYSEQRASFRPRKPRQRAKHKLSLAKNSKEYVAAQREIEQTRESDRRARPRSPSWSKPSVQGESSGGTRRRAQGPAQLDREGRRRSPAARWPRCRRR